MITDSKTCNGFNINCKNRYAYNCMQLLWCKLQIYAEHSYPIRYPIFTEILPTCIAFLIGSQQIQGTPSKKLLKKLLALKTLVSTFYKYAYTKQARDDIVKELMTLLKGKHIFRTIFL